MYTAFSQSLYPQMEMYMLPTIEFAVMPGDIFEFDGDVIALKYAQAFYGADEQLALALQNAGVSIDTLQPGVGEYRYRETLGYARASHVLLTGVQRLTLFGYPEIREFAARVIQGVNTYAPAVERVGMTIHGVGYGLDEAEACLAQFEGCLDAIRSLQGSQYLPHLRRITIVDRDTTRVARLRRAMDQYLSSNKRPGNVSKAQADGTYLITAVPDQHTPPPAHAGAGAQETPHVFVAMAFNTDMDDVFYYGIEAPIHSSGFLL